MITKIKEEYCQHCGADFSHRSYSDKIHHSNHCDEFNANVGVHRFNNAKTKEEKLEWLFDAVGIDGTFERTSYESTMEIFECLVSMYRRGIYGDKGKKAHPKIADYMESKKHKIKKRFNQLYKEKITEIENESKEKIERLKKRMVK